MYQLNSILYVNLPPVANLFLIPRHGIKRKSKMCYVEFPGTCTYGDCCKTQNCNIILSHIIPTGEGGEEKQHNNACMEI